MKPLRHAFKCCYTDVVTRLLRPKLMRMTLTSSLRRCKRTQSCLRYKLCALFHVCWCCIIKHDLIIYQNCILEQSIDSIHVNPFCYCLLSDARLPVLKTPFIAHSELMICRRTRPILTWILTKSCCKSVFSKHIVDRSVHAN